ncbi:MAG: hypothetical protein OXF96_07295 [Chloroflexi bacterium]|nr:hypothetical protein [Chloroflexota bacterium]
MPPATITQGAATVAIRAATDAESVPDSIATAVGALFPAAVELCAVYAPDAPAGVQNAAVVRVLGWLWEAEPGNADVRPLHASGAAPLLAPWRVHRAGAIAGAAAPPTPTPTPTPSGLPTPPASGHYILASDNGELEWLEFPEP